MRAAAIAAALSCAGLLCACAVPEYQPPSSVGLGHIRFVNIRNPYICQGGKPFSLRPDGNGNVNVAAGRAIHVTGTFEQGAGRCDTAVIFTPQANRSYDIVNEVRAEHCVATVMLRDASAQHGVSLVASVLPARRGCR